MKSKFLILAIFFSISTSAQESRIALVIGNSSYEKGALRNPVNDALLMQTTFQNLGFDVILDTNINTRDRFITTISNFLDKRVNYDVAFVYYAGHAVQIGGENYMLATEETYNSERDARNFGVNINDFIEDYQDPVANKINVLIIDACRNNPFEQNWTPQNRSIENGLGLGLAEMKNLPTGTIIAYSTQPGYTASDGKDQNSLYCLSLAQNFMLEGVRIEDVFAKVKKEVRVASLETQKPTYTNDLEGTAFYLKITDLTNQIIEIDSLIDAGSSLSMISAREKISALLALHPNDKRCLLRKGRLELYNESIEYDGADLFKADKLFPNDSEVKLFLARYYRVREDFENALKEIDNSISLNTEGTEAYEWKANILIETGDTTGALKCFSKLVELDKNNPEHYTKRADFFIQKNDFNNALLDLDKAIDLSPNAINYNNRADFHNFHSRNLEKAKEDYESAFLISSDQYEKSRSLHNLGLVYFEQKEYEIAIEKFNKSLEIDSTSPQAWMAYSNRADAYMEIQEFELAIADYTKAIELDKETTAERYEDRANLFITLEDDTEALKDLDRAIDLSPTSYHYNNRGDFYKDYLHNYEKAIEDYQFAVQLATDEYQTGRAINNQGLIYINQKNYDQAIDYFSKSIELDTESSLTCVSYTNRALSYMETQKLELAEEDFSKAIELDKENAERYENRANLFIRKGDYTNAIEDLNKAIEISPTTRNYCNRADFYKNYLLNDEKAIEDYQFAVQLATDEYQTGRAIQNQALIYFKQKKHNIAVELYSKAVELDPESWIAYSNRADVYAEMGQFEKALVDLTKAIELNKTSGLYIKRGVFFNNIMKQPYSSLVDYSLAIAIDSSNQSAWWKRGQLFSDKFTDYKSAISDFKQIIELDTNEVAAMNWIGVFYKNMNEEENAIKYYKNVISKVGTNFSDSAYSYSSIAWSYNNLGNMYKLKKDKSLANIYYENAVKYGNLEPEKHNNRAWFLELYLKNHIEALKSINKSIELDNENPKWQLGKAKILLHSNDISNAENCFINAVEKSKKSPNYISELANFYSVIGEYSKADKLFNEVLKPGSVIALVHHHKTEHLIRQNKMDEAIISANEGITKFKNDTVSFEQLGRIFMSKKEYLKALKAYESGLAIMDFNEAPRNIYDAVLQVYSSDVCLKIYEIYTILNETALACEMLNRAEAHAQIETRPDNLIIQEKIKSLKLNCPN